MRLGPHYTGKTENNPPKNPCQGNHREFENFAKTRGIGRVRKIAVEKGRPNTSQVISGRSQVPASAGTSESDHSGVPPVKFHWSGT